MKSRNRPDQALSPLTGETMDKTANGIRLLKESCVTVSARGKSVTIDCDTHEDAESMFDCLCDMGRCLEIYMAETTGQ